MKPGPEGRFWYGFGAAVAIEIVGAAVIGATVGLIWWLW